MRLIAIMALSQLQLIALLAVGAASAGVPIMGTKDAGAAPEPTEIAADKMKAVKEALAKDKGRGGWRGKMGDGWRGLAEKAKGAAGGAAGPFGAGRRGFPGGGFAGMGGANFTELKAGMDEMHVWWCGQEGKEETIPCLTRRMLDASPEERAQYREKMGERYKRKYVEGGTPTAKMETDEMHDQWCAMEAHKEGAVCTRWAKQKELAETRKQRRAAGGAKEKVAFGVESGADADDADAAEDGRMAAARKKRLERATEAKRGPGSGEKRRAEMQLLTASYCAEKEGNDDTAPCMSHLMQKETDAAKKKELSEAMRGIDFKQRQAQWDAAYEFWCNNPDENRDEQGVCLSWKLRRDRALTAKQGVGKKPELPGDRPGFGDLKKSTVNKPSSMPQSKADRERFRKEMDGMHEWYCTSTKPEVEASQVCIRWRMQLKTLSKEERAKLQAISRENAEKMRKAMAAEKEAKKGSDPEATAKAEQELKELREHGKAAFNEMRRAWCEEGGGKDKSDEESQVCARWRVEGVKAEL